LIKSLFHFLYYIFLAGFIFSGCQQPEEPNLPTEGTSMHEIKINALVNQMSLVEKIGQMTQVNGDGGIITEDLRNAIEKGQVGSVLNEIDTKTLNELQRIAVEDSRLGIPLMIGRDVIHGFKTIFPIPLGQAASWNPEVVRKGAEIAAIESASVGINWTFAPMIDISRDPRWGRIAESLGEDPYLTGVLGAAMVKGFQGEDLSNPNTIAACAKHFAGYGASESGRDYWNTNIAQNELRNIYLPPFKACLDAGVATFMASFSDIDGVPASGNEFLMRQVLREEWDFQGFVVSDWESIKQLSVHGFTANDLEAASEAANAGIDMEMASTTYRDHLESLVNDGKVSREYIDQAVRNILRIKFSLGLFDNPYTDTTAYPALANADHLAAAKKAVLESIVLLKNKENTLPLKKEDLKSLAIIGPLADDPFEQMGTWVFDGDPQYSQTCLQAIREHVGDDIKLNVVKAMETSRSHDIKGSKAIATAVKKSDAVLLFLGEEAILSGEAHSRADISLPGAQDLLIQQITALGKPTILIIMAGRPLTIEKAVDQVDAVLYAWHPGSMGGPAISDLLFGVESPSGKLPVTFPKMVGQIPMYYNHKNSGKPPTPETVMHMDSIPVRAAQLSVGNTSFHLDAGAKPLFPFGFGLSYTEFKFGNIKVSNPKAKVGEDVVVSAEVINLGDMEADEVVQLYVRDLVGNVTRPVKELKGFQKIHLKPGENRTITFTLTSLDLAFYNRNMQLVTEPGQFDVWIGGSSEADLKATFELH